MKAPEKIWAFLTRDSDDPGHKFGSCWTRDRSKEGYQPYIRTDLSDAAIAEARREALREAADKVREWQAFTKYAKEPIAEEMAQDVLSLIDKEPSQ